MALNIMRTQASMAGYSSYFKVDDPSQTMNGRGFAATPVFGCSGSNFGSYHGIVNAVACTGTSTSDTLEVAYEANDNTWGGGSSNAILDGAGHPLDCLGNALDAAVLGYYLADSKFYVSGNKLYCEGPGTTGVVAAPLVDNIENLSIKYGLSSATAGAALSQIAMYSSAPGAAPNAGAWKRVMSISICVVVRSAVPVIDKTVGTAKNALDTYVDCAGNTAHSADGYLRRSFSTTVLLQNRIL